MVRTLRGKWWIPILIHRCEEICNVKILDKKQKSITFNRFKRPLSGNTDKNFFQLLETNVFFSMLVFTALNLATRYLSYCNLRREDRKLASLLYINNTNILSCKCLCGSLKNSSR